MNQIELKGKSIEKIVGATLLLVSGFLIAPFIFVAFKGLLGLALAGGFLTFSYYLMPSSVS